MAGGWRLSESLARQIAADLSRVNLNIDDIMDTGWITTGYGPTPNEGSFEKDVNSMASYEELAKRSAEMQRAAEQPEQQQAQASNPYLRALQNTNMQAPPSVAISGDSITDWVRNAGQQASLPPFTAQMPPARAMGDNDPFRQLVGNKAAMQQLEDAVRLTSMPGGLRAASPHSSLGYERRFAIAKLAAEAAKDMTCRMGHATPAGAADVVVKAYIEAWEALGAVK